MSRPANAGVATSRATSSRRRQRHAAEQRFRSADATSSALNGSALRLLVVLQHQDLGGLRRIGDGRREDERLAGAGGDPGGLRQDLRVAKLGVRLQRQRFDRPHGGIRVDSIHNW
ncbi:hypothetical protein BHE74_00016592 [Ensete ventricosum]|nr:hypothetical protein BHE74_00016592 [Ensete ventricosum]